MRFIQKFSFFLPLVLVLGGIFNISEGVSQDVAPYPYADIPETSILKLLHLQKKFLLERLKKYPLNGLDQGALAGTYSALSSQTGDLTYIDKAEAMARKSLINLPFYNNGAKLILAEVAEARHQFPQAIEAAEEILKKSPTNISALNIVVTASLGNGRLAVASRYADRLVQATPDLSTVTLSALTKVAQGKNDAALADFKKALSLERPDSRLQSAWLRSLIARFYYRLKDFNTASKYSDSALSVLPNYHVALALKGEIEAQRSNNKEAIRFLNKAYQARNEPPYLLSMATIRDKEGNSSEAKRLRSEAEYSVRHEIDETLYGHFNELAQILIDRGNPSQREEAIEAAKKNVEQRNNSESHFILAQAYYNAGKIDDARNSLKIAISTGETNFQYQLLADKIQ